MPQPGFVKAQSDNLPRVDVLMVSDFFTNTTLNVAESRGVKAHRYVNYFASTTILLMYYNNELHI